MVALFSLVVLSVHGNRISTLFKRITLFLSQLYRTYDDSFMSRVFLTSSADRP